MTANYKNRLTDNNFDLLRLVFATIVFVFHAAILSDSPSLSFIKTFFSAGFAVEAFFYVSGFLVFMSWDNSKSFKSFFKKRFFRLAPAYTLVIVASAFFLAPFSEIKISSYFDNYELVKYIISNLALLNFIQPSLPGVFTNNPEMAVNGSLWTIKIEVAFYILVPLIAHFIYKYNYKNVLFCIFVISIIWHLGFATLGAYYNNELLLRLAKQIPGQISFFVVGIYAYFRTKNGMIPTGLTCAVFSAFAYSVTNGLLHDALAPFCIYFIVYFLSVKVPTLWTAKKLGDISYGIYLYHFPLVQLFVMLGLYTSYPYTALFLNSIIVVFLAILSWHFYESKFVTKSHRER